MAAPRRVGVIGLGKMGGPISGRIAAAGHEVFGFDVDASARAQAARHGVVVLDSVRAVAEASEGTIVLVGSEQAAADICLDDVDGLLIPGKAIVICSTVSADLVHQVAQRAATVGADVLDAPLARGEGAARAGTLLVLAAGARAVFKRWEDVLSAFGSDVAFLGAAGAGQIAKTINNYLLWASVVATAEGMRLAQAHGIDFDALIEALLTSSGESYALRTWQLARDMPWAEKDMQIAVQSFSAAGVKAPLAGVVEGTIAALKAEKNGWQGERVDISMDEFIRHSG